MFPSTLKKIIPFKDASYYQFFYNLCKVFKPVFTLELGTNTGISSACLAEGNPNGHVVTVDIVNVLNPECKRSNVEYRIHDSLIKVPLDKKIDLLFIDTIHDGIRCLDEFNLYKDDISDHGLVFFDDITLFPCMINFWRNFNPPSWTKMELPLHGTAGFGGAMKDISLLNKYLHGI